MKTYTFRCPVCRKILRSDEPGEPCCTGPSETRHEHPLAVMRLLRIDDREIAPLIADRRAAGPLIIIETGANAWRR